MAGLILHIGTHKTGTTAIQRSLAADEGRLEESSLHLLGRTSTLRKFRPSTLCKLMCAESVDPEVVQACREEPLRRLREPKASAGDTHILAGRRSPGIHITDTETRLWSQRAPVRSRRVSMFPSSST